jgi:hypothetical protein
MVFTVAMCSTLMAYIARLPVSFFILVGALYVSYDMQIPDKSLDEPEPAEPRFPQRPAQTKIGSTTGSVTSPLEIPSDSDDEDEEKPMLRTEYSRTDLKLQKRPSGYELVDDGMDLEKGIIGGSARKN